MKLLFVCGVLVANSCVFMASLFRGMCAKIVPATNCPETGLVDNSHVSGKAWKCTRTDSVVVLVCICSAEFLGRWGVQCAILSLSTLIKCLINEGDQGSLPPIPGHRRLRRLWCDRTFNSSTYLIDLVEYERVAISSCVAYFCQF